MKNFVLFAFLLSMFFSGCSKNETGCTSVEPRAEESQILAYALKDSINVTKHSSGIYYQIIDSGRGAAPERNSALTVTYIGKFLDETKFEEAARPVSFNLGTVIEGWQIGLRLIKKGGRIKLIIPSAYAYGCNGKKDHNHNFIIPRNSVLFFDVNLLNVQ